MTRAAPMGEQPCPGCGVRLPAAYASGTARFNASNACWARFGELTAYTMTRPRDQFIHQLAVDAYGAQHLSATASAITGAFSLIGLFLACERGYSGLAIQRVHTQLARRAKAWPRVQPPPSVGALTVADVLAAQPGRERDEAIRAWNRAVWLAWAEEHARVRELFERVMAG